MTPSIRCHYDVLDVPRDADEKIIKKAHRKKALKYHPDKNFGDQDAAKEFQLIQQAYECLSDPQERKYYDEHRESILRGIKPGDEDDGDISYVFDVTPYHFSGCYDGYGDGVGGFFHTYRLVFDQIMKGERNGWISEGNIDETKMPNHFLPNDFGDGSTPWKEVSYFYNSWQGFTSCLSFAWVDTYDPRDAESRYVRRRIDDENRKVRKVARRKRNDEIIQLVAFVKKKDPRVIAARNKAENDKLENEERKKEEAIKKKKAAAAAREEWKRQREEAMREMEDEDLNAGRIRLADLDDDSDDSWYGHSNRKGKGKKGKGSKSKGKKKKKGKKNRQRWSSSEEEDEHEVATSTIDAEGDNASADGTADKNDGVAQQSGAMATSKDAHDEEGSSAKEPEEEVFKCDCCQITFLNSGQLENHFKSKKHKLEAIKKKKAAAIAKEKKKSEQEGAHEEIEMKAKENRHRRLPSDDEEGSEAEADEEVEESDIGVVQVRESPDDSDDDMSDDLFQPSEALGALEDLDLLENSEHSDEEEESSSEEESEPEVFKCDVCRKVFKSRGQMENHMKSKKHKEAFKKWQKKNSGS